MSLMFISAIYGIILARGLAEHRFLNCIEFIARKTRHFFSAGLGFFCGRGWDCELFVFLTFTI
jgi:hypothetical protein